MGDPRPGARRRLVLFPLADELDPGELVEVELLRVDVTLGLDEPEDLLHPDGPWR